MIAHPAHVAPMELWLGCFFWRDNYKHCAPNGAVVLHRNVTRCFAFAGEGFYMKIGLVRR